MKALCFLAHAMIVSKSFAEDVIIMHRAVQVYDLTVETAIHQKLV